MSTNDCLTNIHYFENGAFPELYESMHMESTDKLKMDLIRKKMFLLQMSLRPYQIRIDHVSRGKFLLKYRTDRYMSNFV